jgi:hypothetical protein
MATSELALISPGPRREQIEAQIANTLALVAYHSKQNEEALRLELLADHIARSSEDASMREWADVTLALNRAKLIERRFGDADGALRLLRGLVGHVDRSVNAQASCDVARLLAQQEDWKGLIEVVNTAMDGPILSMFREDEELSLLLLRTVALAAIGERAKALRECRRLKIKNRVVGSPIVAHIVRSLEDVRIPESR